MESIKGSVERSPSYHDQPYPKVTRGYAVAPGVAWAADGQKANIDTAAANRSCRRQEAIGDSPQSRHTPPTRSVVAGLLVEFLDGRNRGHEQGQALRKVGLPLLMLFLTASQFARLLVCERAAHALRRNPVHGQQGRLARRSLIAHTQRKLELRQ